MWAENVSVVVARAYHDPLVGVVRPFRGYVNIAATAWIPLVRLVPVHRIPLAVLVITAAVYGLVAGFSARASSWYLESRWLSVLVGLAVAILPILSADAIASLVHLQFVLLYAAFWGLLIPIHRRIGAAMLAIGMFLVALSSPLAVALLPLGVLACRDPRRRAATIALAAGVVVQVVVWRTGWGGGRRVGSGLAASVTVPKGIEGLFASLGPLRIGGLEGSSRTVVSVFVFLLVFGGVVLLLSTERPRSAQQPQATLALVSVSVAVLIVVIASLANPQNADRYLVAPGLLVVASLAAQADWVFHHRSGRRSAFASVLVVAAAALFGMGVITNWSVGALRRSGAVWSEGIAAARRECATQDVTHGVVRDGVFPWASARIECQDL